MLKTSLKDIDTIIFDFDGTIADTLFLGIEISNQLTEKYKHKKIASKADLEVYRNLSTQNALKAIGISFYKLPFIANSFRKILAENIPKLKPIEGIEEIIPVLSAHFKLGVLTSNSEENTVNFLKKYNLDHCFTYYATGIGLFKKNRTIRNLIKQHGFNPTNMLLVGDETRDIEAAKKCNLPIVSVTWGFHNAIILKSYQPDYLIDHPSELIHLLGIK